MDNPVLYKSRTLTYLVNFLQKLSIKYIYKSKDQIKIKDIIYKQANRSYPTFWAVIYLKQVFQKNI